MLKKGIGLNPITIYSLIDFLILYSLITEFNLRFCRSLETTVSKNKPRKTAISGKGTKRNIMQSLKDIDEKILGPNGQKDTGVILNDKELLNGFLEGYTDTAKEEFHQKVWTVVGALTLVTSISIATYYIMFYHYDLNTEY